MSRSTRIVLTIMILSVLYLAGVRFISQLIISTDRSSLFATTLGNILSTPQVFNLSATSRIQDSRVQGQGTNDPSFLLAGTSATRPALSGVHAPQPSTFRDSTLKTQRITLKTLCILDPFNADYQYLLARELTREGLASAEARARQAVRLSAVDPKNWLLLGWVQGKKGFIEKGYAAFDRAVMLDPKRPDSFAQQGMYLYQVWLHADAKEKSLYHTLAFLSFRTALELDRRFYWDPNVNTAVASLYQSSGSPAHAINILAGLPDNVVLGWPLTFQRMALFFELGEGVKAISTWKKQFNRKALSPQELESLEREIRTYNIPEFAYPLAQVHIAQGKLDAALSELTGLVAKKRESAEYKITLASVYEHLGNHKEAARLYEEALRLSPANQEAKKKVMQYYSQPVMKWLK